LLVDVELPSSLPFRFLWPVTVPRTLSEMSDDNKSPEDDPVPSGQGDLGQTESFERPEMHTECISSDHQFSLGPTLGNEEIFGDYRIVEHIGAGGMGIVYKAINVPLNRAVALKVLPSTWRGGKPAYRERFAREARAAAKIEHPNVVRVLRAGQIGEDCFIESEYVEGRNLREVITQRGRLDPDHAVGVLRDVAAGLAAVHAHGLVHRDVKPANILTDADGRAKIADFGLVRDQEDDSSLTLPGGVLGSPQYMSPEQCAGKPVDLRSDIYSLGITFYHMLTGKPPFCATTPLAILRQHIDQDIPSASTIVQDLPVWVCGLLERMLAKAPEERYQSCEELINALPNEETDLALPLPTLGQRVKPEATPKKPTVLLAVLPVVLLLVAAMAVAHRYRPKKATALQTADAPPAVVKPRTTDPSANLPPVAPPPTTALPPEMVLIPAGSFTIGEANDKVCGPPHTVYLAAFYIDRQEVSNAAYKRFVDATGHPPPKHWMGNWVATDKADHPVVNVSWHDANAYALWAGKRLPTEAEWERAAAGKDGLPYPWGGPPAVGKANTAEILGEDFSDWDEWLGWWTKWRSSAEGRQAIANGGNTTRCRSFPEDCSPDGCFDVIGNVYEWTDSWLKPYAETEYDHPNFGKTHRVVRGGSWFLNMQSGRAQHRSNHLPTDASSCIGFRCAKSIPPEEPGQE
jgi:eukaryotic-like serine/threonine-protein kinase